MASGGVQGLNFVVYLYDDHSRLTVTRRDYAPRDGSDRRIGSVRLGVGLADLAGLAPAHAVRSVAASILVALDPDILVRSTPAPPDGGHGGEHVVGQLRLDLPE